MDGEKVIYTDWKIGKELVRELSYSHPLEDKTDLLCPFDNAPILFCYDEMSKWFECPSCDIPYSGMRLKTQDEANRVAKEHFQDLEKRLEELSSEQVEISKLLKVADSKGLYNHSNKK